MRINAEGYAMICSFEELRLRAYKPVPTDPWTIGWGHTGEGVHEGMLITPQDADRLLHEDIDVAERIVIAAVTMPLTGNEFSALVSFVFNVGPGQAGKRSGFVHLKEGGPSTLLARVNAGLYKSAALEFPKWNRSGGRILDGLTQRRLAEQALFMKPRGPILGQAVVA